MQNTKRSRHSPFAIGLLGGVLLLGHAASGIAGPLAAPGDSALRHDLQLLSDHGLLSAPITTWPLSWSDIQSSLTTTNEDAALQPHIRNALQRVEARLARVNNGRMKAAIELAGNSDPELLRGFGDTPRSKGEIRASAQGSNERVAFELKATAIADPADDRPARLDGSYAAVVLGNVMASVAAVDRWWGPGWDGSLILSSNARPVPALVLQRERSTPFATPLLSWLGPWQLTTFMGQLESDRVVADPLLFGMRLNFRPLKGLEIGMSRTAQWCGEGRPCDLGTFGDLFLGNDNNNEQLTIAQEPGNQLGGFDFRWAVNALGQSSAVYAQVIGEDEADGLPSRHFGMGGFETWGAWGNEGSSWRAVVEVADTTVGLFRDETYYNTAYNHHIYRSGYRYRGRSMGHGADNDSRTLTLSVLVTDTGGNAWQVTGRHADFNRDDAGLNPFSPRHTEYDSIALRHERPLATGRITLEAGLHHTRLVADGSSETDPSVALAWEKGW